jgi:N-acetyl-gamma-glutamyl-phosphate reductase
MHKRPVGIVGASGYSGMEATRLLSRHPSVELRFLTSDRWVDETVGQHLGPLGPVGQLTYVAQEQAEARASGCEVVLLATPAEISFQLVPKLLRAGTRVVDLSGAFRLADRTAAQKWYGLSHPDGAPLDEAVYGLPELYRNEIASARLVANPGCYPTGAILPLLPLIRRGLLEPDPIVINAASGVTGAGRKVAEEYGFVEIDGDYRAYRVLRHQHTPEIAQTLSRVAGHDIHPVFTPHLLPIKRGILTTTFARLKPAWGVPAVAAALGDAYRNESFVMRAGTAEEVSLKKVVGTNLCQIGFALEGERLILVSAIDNLVKGAAGQAVQNMNLMLGLDEGEGLAGLRTFYP